LVADTARLSPPDLFTSLIEGLFADITARVINPWGRLTPVEWLVIKLIWRRLRRMSRRFATILAQLRAGTLPPMPVRTRLAADPRRDRPSDGPRLSQRLGWVIYAVSYFVWMRHYELQELLEDPETQTLVADAPQFGSVLRPLCRMLKVKPPAWLRRPRTPRPAATIPPAPDWLLNEPGAQLRPDGSVWMHLGSSTHWRPGSGQTLEQAQKLDPPIRIWPRAE
jgi:hypothetical protein